METWSENMNDMNMFTLFKINVFLQKNIVFAIHNY